MEEPARLSVRDMQILLEEERVAFNCSPIPFNFDNFDLCEEIISNPNDEDSGQEVQRSSVVRILPDLLRENNNDCMRRVVPKVREVLHVAQSELQLAACGAFLQILQGNLVPIQKYTETFLQSILTSLDSKDPDVSSAWLNTLLDVIDLLPKEAIKKDILNLAISKGQLSQPVSCRLICCKILGKVATKFESFFIKKEILPLVLSLCQDVDYEVRGCMCRQLDNVARGLGLELTKSSILPELVELTHDESIYVRLAGFETVASVLTLLDDDSRSNIIIPLVCKFCQQSIANEDITLPVIAKLFGQLCIGLAGSIPSEQKKWFCDYYKKLCRVGLSDVVRQQSKESPSSKIGHTNNNIRSGLALLLANNSMEIEEDPQAECRKNAAYNFPAMLMFVGAQNYKTTLHSTLVSLCSDPNPLVRRTIAAGFHELCKVLGSNAYLIYNELNTLLKDDSPEVLNNIITHLPKTLDIFLNSINPETKASSVSSDLITSILQCRIVVFASNKWRIQADLMEKLSCLHEVFSSSEIYTSFIPVLFKTLHKARALPVRIACARTLLILLRKNRRQDQRHEMCTRFVTEFGHSRSCYKRHIFIDVCKIAVELFSHSFIKRHLFEAAIDLASDRAPSVRLRLYPLLPQLKSLLKLPADRTYFQQLEYCARRQLGAESDMPTTIRDAAVKAVKEMDKVKVHVESLVKDCMSVDALADQVREREERELVEMEEQDRREEEMRIEKKKKESGGSLKRDPTASRIPAPRRALSTKSSGTSVTSVSYKAALSQTSSSLVRSERSGSFSGSSSSVPPKEVKRIPSLNNKTSSASKIVTKPRQPASSTGSLPISKTSSSAGGAGTSKKVATNVPSPSSTSDSESRTPNQRRISAGSLPISSIPAVKKKAT